MIESGGRAGRWLAVVGLAAFAAVLYTWDLGRAPAYLGGDEAHFGVQAHALAHTGSDLNGQHWPLLINLRDPKGDVQNRDVGRRWYQPTFFYLTALVLTLRPLSEEAVRLPAALIGILDVVLLYLVGLKLFADRRAAALPALLLVLTPAHLIFSRQATDFICGLPFVLAWLWCVLAFEKSGRASLAFAAGLILGLGVYSHLAAWLLMPIFLLVTWAAVFLSAHKSAAAAVAAGLGFAIPVGPLLVWLWSHPEMLRDTLSLYRTGEAFGFDTVQDRISTYWSYFDPSFLFLNGGASLTATTGRAGVFLLPLAVLLPVGVYDITKRWSVQKTVPVLLLGGLLAAPIPAALAGERYAIQRELFVVPFVVIIAACGAWRLMQHAYGGVRFGALLLLGLMPLQFAYTCLDYFGDYQLRSGSHFDPGEFRLVSDYLLAEDAARPVPAIYLNRQLDDGSARWRFYLTKHGRLDLLGRTRYFDGDGLDLGHAAPGSLIVIVANGYTLNALRATGQWELAKAIIDTDRDVVSMIIRKLEESPGVSPPVAGD